MNSQRTSGWHRTVTTTYDNGIISYQTETLDMNAAVERLWEAIHERPDIAMRDWLDVALNGWPA